MELVSDDMLTGANDREHRNKKDVPPLFGSHPL